MPRKARSLETPRLNYLRYRFTRAAMTDGGGTTGTIACPGTLPAGAYVLGTQVRVFTGFGGDTTATVQVGDGSDVDRYTTGTPSVLAALPAGVDVGVPSGVRYHETAKTVTVTITGGADFTAITAGDVEICVAYIEFPQ